ncbi:TIGR00159 family protein [Xylanibacillus composti]|uniref:Diadenylate cyclase n=1 Tax=Xylanibacillus composti TaxID=1572762 RepID=A0A8J4M313_9BACL|nr:diadenylate cyclase CdaA [Xylanibacillus composti]MDT9724109.1 TIGR00159 family protein [Xylanibacillus composti]GIQ69502.1 cyclic di-AMP synthase CdaA [Xylanibacillus composti]
MGIFEDMKITDIIDILIVSYIMYRLILVVKGTRAVQLLKGIMIIMITWAVSVWFNLDTLKWLMNQMITVGVLAVIVIFQPELRRALEQLGRGKLFLRTVNEDDQEFNQRIGEVIKAVNYLAKRKIGALIVFERSTGLNDYTESGIQLNAQISSELLINMFTPNTPLHDGAVIIKQNTIAAGGCYLPLSENPFISKELGTRHRAAIGMSEVSDAICIVVSEETGQISLAMNGQVVRDITEESLISKLFADLRPQTKERGSFWRRKGGQANG